VDASLDTHVEAAAATDAADVSVADVSDAQTDDVATPDDAGSDPDADAGPMACPCTFPWICCDKVCVYPLTDPKNCGSCGVTCQHACVNRICN
jgi:hypothetical protein